VLLPVAVGSGRRGRSELMHGAGPGAADGVLTALRLLVVEDHHDTAELMRAVLERQGAEVRIADSLTAALAALDRAEFHVLISDIAMPDGTGHELLRAVRADERARSRGPVPAVAITAFAGTDDRERASASGFQHFAAKPIEPSELVDTVARAAGRTPVRGRGRVS
jgi:CheY-like chemotaxis protein